MEGILRRAVKRKLVGVGAMPVMPGSANDRRAGSDRDLGAWLERSSVADVGRTDAASSAAAEPGRARPRRKSILRDDSVRVKSGSVSELAAVALHGRQALRGDPVTFVQHLSSTVAFTVSTAKLDTVNFSLSDRISAWLSGQAGPVSLGLGETPLRRLP